MRVIPLMRLQRLAPNIITYNAALGAARGGAAHCAEVMRALAEEELQPDATTFSTAIGAAGARSDWAQALAFFEEALRRSLRPRDAYAPLLLALVKGGRWPAALELAGPRRLLAATACARGSAWEAALLCATWGPGQEHLVALSALLQALARRSRWEASAEIFAEHRRRRLVADLALLGAAASAAASAQRWPWALELLAAAEAPSLVLYNCAMNACVAAWPRALALLAAMRGGRLSPTSLSLCAAIGACARATRWEAAVSLCAEDPAPLNAAASACEASAAWRPALALLRGGEPALRAAVSACWKSGASSARLLRLLARPSWQDEALCSLELLRAQGLWPSAWRLRGLARAHMGPLLGRDCLPEVKALWVRQARSQTSAALLEVCLPAAPSVRVLFVWVEASGILGDGRGFELPVELLQAG